MAYSVCHPPPSDITNSMLYVFVKSSLIRFCSGGQLFMIRPQGRKKIMLNSAELEIFLFINVKIPTIVGILTFVSRKNSILGLAEPEKMLNFMIFLYL